MEFSTSKSPSTTLILRYASSLVHSSSKKDQLEGQRKLLEFLNTGSSVNIAGSGGDNQAAPASPVKDISIEDQGFCLYYLTIVNIRLGKWCVLKWCIEWRYWMEVLNGWLTHSHLWKYILNLVDTMLENYREARKWCDLLSKHPSNSQASKKLRQVIDSRIQKDAAIGLGIAGGLVAGAAFLGYTFIKLFTSSHNK